MSEDALWLTGGIAAVLTLASATAGVLRRRLARGQPHPVIDNLAERIRSWWWMAALLGLVFWAGHWATVLLFAVLGVLALREYIVTLPSPRLRDWVSGILICIVCIGFIPALLMLDIPGYSGRNLYLVVFLLLVTQASDVLQYIWGKLAGRHLIAPSISPSKTVEGFIGGALSAALIGASVGWSTPFTLVQATLMALLLVLLGFAGGLYLSAQKRARGIKDWGRLIKGHGGVLDRLDSLWLPAPVYFTLIKLGFCAS